MTDAFGPLTAVRRKIDPLFVYAPTHAINLRFPRIFDAVVPAATYEKLSHDVWWNLASDAMPLSAEDCG